ncbi:MAG: hypothetical protein ACLSFJ_06700 [Holdemania filiformis]
MQNGIIFIMNLIVKKKETAEKGRIGTSLFYNMFTITLMISAPIIIAALGGLFSERSGVVTSRWTASCWSGVCHRSRGRGPRSDRGQQ